MVILLLLLSSFEGKSSDNGKKEICFGWDKCNNPPTHFSRDVYNP